MRKFFSFSVLLALCLCLSALAGCHTPTSPNNEASHENAVPDPANMTFHFDSYDDMIWTLAQRGFLTGNTAIQSLKDTLGDPYTRFIDRVSTDKAFPHPTLNGEPIPYRNQEGFSNITFFADELYGLPWVWYFPEVSTGENFYIAVTYLPDDLTTTSESQTASEVIRVLSHESPNLHNLGDQHKSIRNREIPLRDRTVTALVVEYKDDTRSSILFVYDDLLVLVRCNPTVWSEAWFASLGFDPVG